MKRIWDKIMSRVMLLPLIVVAPLLSPVAGLIWWVCVLFGRGWFLTDTTNVVPTVTSCEIGGDVYISVAFMDREYELFYLKKRNEGE